MDIRKRVYDLPELGKKAMMIAIPTTSGTGSEARCNEACDMHTQLVNVYSAAANTAASQVTPFSVITDETTGQKFPLADYALTPVRVLCTSAASYCCPPLTLAAHAYGA
jgi:acetaldehyde dehydrogenase/alcohol dehydrogenase